MTDITPEMDGLPVRIRAAGGERHTGRLEHYGPVRGFTSGDDYDWLMLLDDDVIQVEVTP